MEKLAKLLHEIPNAKILDVGTGMGNFIKLITSCYNDFHFIVGIDTYQTSIKRAKESFNDNRISFTVMNGESMSYDDNSFDVVCLSNSLHHLSHIDVLLKEMRRVVKKEGIILIAEMINNDLTKKQLSHLKIHHFAAKIDRLLGDSHNETYSLKEIHTLLEEKSECTIQTSWILNLLSEDELPDRFKWFENTVSRLIKRIPEHLLTEDLIGEGNKVVEYIKEHGFDSCPTLMVVMKK